MQQRQGDKKRKDVQGGKKDGIPQECRKDLGRAEMWMGELRAKGVSVSSELPRLRKNI